MVLDPSIASISLVTSASPTADSAEPIKLAAMSLLATQLPPALICSKSEPLSCLPLITTAESL